MRIMVESFKRLYNRGKITKEQVRERVEKGLISKEEYVYITGELYDTESEVNSESDSTTSN